MLCNPKSPSEASAVSGTFSDAMRKPLLVKPQECEIGLDRGVLEFGVQVSGLR